MRANELFMFIEQASLSDYDFDEVKHHSEYCRPWLLLSMNYALNGARVSIFTGFALATFYRCGYQWQKLTRQARTFKEYINYLSFTMPYTSLLGMVCGVCYSGVCDLQAIQPCSLEEQLAREREEAKHALCNWAKRKEYVRYKLWNRLSWYEKLLAKFHVHEEAFMERWVKMLSLQSINELNKTQQDFLPIHGVLWIQAHSTVHDASNYYNHSDYKRVARELIMPELLEKESKQAELRAQLPLTTMMNDMCSTRGHLTKLQMDYIMSRFHLWLSSADDMRWCTTACAGITLTAVVKLFTESQGNWFYRVNHSIATGIVVSSLVSYLKLDNLHEKQQKSRSNKTVTKLSKSDGESSWTNNEEKDKR